MAADPNAIQAKAWEAGASRGNPGEAGFGMAEICGLLGRTTNNVAVDLRTPPPDRFEIELLVQ